MRVSAGRSRISLVLLPLLLVILLIPSQAETTLLPPIPHRKQGPPPQDSHVVRGPTDPAEMEAFLDGVMKIQLEQHHTAGAVVTVVKDGEVFLAKGYGYADWEARIPVDPATTLFRIGSVTKLFVWTSVMQLVEEGALELDTDINEYLSAFQIPATYPEPITLRHLLTHSPGFEDWVVGLFGTQEEDFRSLAEILADQIPARVRPPGEVSSYSNHGTAMAALIVEEVSGRSWGEYIRERVLDPLGMEYFSVDQPLPEELASHMSKGYAYGGGEFKEKDFERVPLYPVGAASASGEAMARFMMAHLQLGTLDGKRILEEETARRMQSDLFKMAPDVNATLHGFYEMSANGERIIGHGGDTFWFHSELALFPEHDLGVFVSFNSEQGGGATGEFVDAFVDRYFPAEEVLPQLPEDFQARGRRFAGSFRANRFSHTSLAKVAALDVVEVSLTEGNTLKALGSEWVEVGPLTFQEKFGDRKLVFRENEAGEITHMFRGDLPIAAFERVPWRDGPVLNLILGLFAGVMMGGAFLAPVVGWGARKWYGVDVHTLDRLPGKARLTLWFGTLTAVVFLVGLVVGVSDSEAIVAGIPAFLKAVLLLPFLVGLLGIGVLWFAVRALRQGQGRLSVRVLYTLTALSFWTFLWQLHNWNLMGWRF